VKVSIVLPFVVSVPFVRASEVPETIAFWIEKLFPEPATIEVSRDS